MKKMSEWYEDWSNIRALIRFLHDVKGVDFDNLMYAMEKPWKYNDEYKEMRELESEEE
tara:strand:- start:2536 stop:2709 length:174 start_codon:yes stop_codon:yes gene_type:complete